jgi:hypothetical protein
MGPRNLLILFFSTVAVSLVILIIFFSLFFKNVDLNFNTRLPESAPEIGGRFGADLNQDSKAEGLMRSIVHVPPEYKESSVSQNASKAEDETSDTDLPPVSDDAVLDDNASPHSADVIETPVEKMPSPAAAPVTPRTSNSYSERRTAAPAQAPAAPPAAEPMPEPIEQEEQSGPPVPGQG